MARAWQLGKRTDAAAPIQLDLKSVSLSVLLQHPKNDKEA